MKTEATPCDRPIGALTHDEALWAWRKDRNSLLIWNGCRWVPRLYPEEEPSDGCYYHMTDDFAMSLPISSDPPACANTDTLLDDAYRLTHTDRGSDYGPPHEDYAKVAKIWTGILLPKLRSGQEVTAAEAAMCMIGIKMSREVHKPHRDNRVDGAGYWWCVDEIRRWEAAQAAAAGQATGHPDAPAQPKDLNDKPV